MRPHSPRTHAQCEQIGKRGIPEILALIGHLLIVELDDQDVCARPCSVRFAILECISANSVSIERLPVRCGFYPLHDLFCLMLAGLAVRNPCPGEHRHGPCDLCRLSGAVSRRLCSLLCVDGRMVQSEDWPRIRRLERLCSKGRECELMVRFKSDANRHGRPSARHGPIAITGEKWRPI
jgi:hypothetical protein